MNDSRPAESAELSADDLLPVKVDVLRVLEIGIVCWVIALVLTLVIPALHGDGRGWWPWTCVSAIIGGAVDWGYVRRGRGTAAAA